MTADDLAAIVATARRPRWSRNGRGIESAEVADRRGTLDIAIAGLAFHAGLRRSEIGRVRAADVAASVPGAVLVTVRRSKTNQDGSAADVRTVKNGPAAALRSLFEQAPAQDARLVPLSGPMVARRLRAVAAAAGVEHRLTGHSGPGRTGQRTHRPRRLDRRRDARGRMEDEPQGGALRGRCHRRTRRRRTVPLGAEAGPTRSRRSNG